MDGTFSLEMFEGYSARMYVSDYNIRPTEPLPLVPAGNGDVNLGDIEVSARPVINTFPPEPARPERGATVRLKAEAASPVGLPVTLRWERQNSRWDWAEIGEGAELDWQVPEGPKSTSIRAVASDGVAESTSYLYITPVNSSPQILSVDVEEELGDVVCLRAAAWG